MTINRTIPLKFSALLHKVSFGISFLGVIVLIAELGFDKFVLSQKILTSIYLVVLVSGITSAGVRHLSKRTVNKRAFVFDILYTFFVIGVLINLLNSIGSASFFNDNHSLEKLAVVLTFIREFSEVKFNYGHLFLNPAQLFIVSFLFIIGIGTFVLMLPNSTYSGISFLDALFTATSAVCVTGLIVVDTGSFFTPFGQWTIMILIQVGGLGILTFASYFSYFFKGGATYQNQLAIRDISNTQKIGEVFSTLKYVLGITFGIELFSALMIYFSLDKTLFQSQYNQLFFSFFHAISAFCNAGFSTLPNSLFQKGFSHNYWLQTIIMVTFIFGGLGFPIVTNIINFIKYKISTLFNRHKNRTVYKPWVLNINSRITLITTFSLSVIAFFLFYVIEYNNTLADHTGAGKVITAFFGATTPRTAGFNSINTSALSFPALMLVFLLMWIGASPASTGGGIKTSTFAIATLNILSLAKGKSKIEIFRREISQISVQRAFAIISLSLIVIGLAVTLISIFDKEKSLMSIAFECFSAYSTVGLSLGITSKLSAMSKLTIIVVMFVGRVSMLSILIAIFKKIKQKNYRYPTEEVIIN